MRNNQPIDLFSSPNIKFIGLSDIRHSQMQMGQQHYQGFELGQEETNGRKHLYHNIRSIVEPIVPFGNDFFDEKLVECEEPQEYTQQQGHLRGHEFQSLDIHHHEDNFFCMDTNYRTPVTIEKSPKHKKSKQTHGLFTQNTMRVSRKDMPHIEQFQQNANSLSVLNSKNQDLLFKFDNQHQIQQSEHQIFTTPKRKPEYSLSNRKFCDSTGQKSISRGNEKGLRRLSSLAFSIVSQSTTTTYKEVAQKLLGHLNFLSNDLEDEDGSEKRSMQNVKRRVYDSLNVLLTLGVIRRVGNKIARQKPQQNKQNSSNHHANKAADQQSHVNAIAEKQRKKQMLEEYNNRFKALETKKKTQKQLKQKLQSFKKIIHRNKMISKNNKLIRLPFLAFVSNEQSPKIDWGSKQSQQSIHQRKSNAKRMGRRGKQQSSQEKDCQSINCNQECKESVSKNDEDHLVKISYRECPQSYGDLDFLGLVESKHLTLQQCRKPSEQSKGHKIEEENPEENSYQFEKGSLFEQSYEQQGENQEQKCLLALNPHNGSFNGYHYNYSRGYNQASDLYENNDCYEVMNFLSDDVLERGQSWRE